MKVIGKHEATVRFGNYTATVGQRRHGLERTLAERRIQARLSRRVYHRKVDKKSRRLKVELSQVPAVEGAMMTLNAKTGEIVTMMGGYDFLTNKFNNAMQAYRQTGSAFKPFIYTAAVEWGMTPDTTVSGAPISIGGWKPHNYDGSPGNGDMPLKTALAKSMNIPAVHLLQTVGIQTGAQMVRRFGIKVPMAPYLPSALGATEVPLDQMVSAYSAFPNKGIRVEPHLIRKVLDRDGAVLEEWEKTTYKVMNEYVALTMVSDDARRRHGRHSDRGEFAAASGRRQDRHGQRSHRRVVHRLHADLRDRRVDGLSGPEEKARQRHDRRRRRAALLRRVHERLSEGQAEGRISEGAVDAGRHERDVPTAAARTCSSSARRWKPNRRRLLRMERRHRARLPRRSWKTRRCRPRRRSDQPPEPKRRTEEGRSREAAAEPPDRDSSTRS